VYTHAHAHTQTHAQVGCICCDRAHEYVVTGDSAGHLRVWDVREGVDVSSPEACRASFKQVGVLCRALSIRADASCVLVHACVCVCL